MSKTSETGSTSAEVTSAKVKQRSLPGKIGYALFIALITVLVILAITLATLSQTVPIAAEHLLKRYDIDFSVESMDINVLRGELIANGLNVKDHNSSESINASKIHLGVDLMQLLRANHVMITRVELSGIEVPVLHDGDNISVAGISPERFASEATTELDAEQAEDASAGFSGTLAWSAIALDDIHIDYSRTTSAPQQQNNQDQGVVNIPLRIEQIAIGSFSTQAPESATPIQAKLELADIVASFAGEATPLDKGRPGHVSAALKNIKLAELVALAQQLEVTLPEITEELSGELNYNSRIDWWITDERSFINLKTSELVADDLFVRLPSGQSVAADLNTNIETVKLALNPFTVSIAALEAYDSTVSYKDDQLTPPADITLEKLAVTLDQFDLAQPRQASAVNLDAALGEFGKLSIKGALSLLEPKSGGKLAVNGEQLNLTEFSGYSFAALSRKISKGALDFNFNADIAEGLIDSKIELEAHQLSLDKVKLADTQTQTAQSAEQPLPAKNTSSFESELGMPLNTALNLLRDKDDTIRLKIPVKGPVDDPSININSIINKAIFKTFKTAVISQLGPLMALSALDKVKSLSDAAKLKPATFLPLQAELAGEELAVLDKLASFLAKRERIKLNVCGVATATEVLPPLATTAESGETVQSKPAELSTAQTEQLLAIAKARGVYAKNYLIDKSIDGKRLILCAAEIDNAADKKPRVDFSL